MNHWLRCPVVLIASFVAVLACLKSDRYPRHQVPRPDAPRSDRLVLRKQPSPGDSPLPLLGTRRTDRPPAPTPAAGHGPSHQLTASAPQRRAVRAGLSAADLPRLASDNSADLSTITREGGWEHRPATCLQPAPRFGPQKPTPQSWRIHRVVDGDDLPSLALRYLDDADRYLEIFHANRHLLSRPDVLPLGVELRIPAAEPQETREE